MFFLLLGLAFILQANYFILLINIIAEAIMADGVADTLKKLWEISPYLGVFAGGVWTGRAFKTPATEKEWKSLIRERKELAKNLQKDLDKKEERLDEFHGIQTGWDSEKQLLKKEINRLKYNNDKSKLTPVEAT
jgi:hypothetical protein